MICCKKDSEQSDDDDDQDDQVDHDDIDDDDERSQKVQELWQLLKQYGVDPHLMGQMGDYDDSGFFAIETVMWTQNPSKTVTKLFFDDLSLCSRQFQERVVRNETVEDDSRTLAEVVIWNFMTGGRNRTFVWNMLKPYTELNMHWLVHGFRV